MQCDLFVCNCFHGEGAMGYEKLSRKIPKGKVKVIFSSSLACSPFVLMTWWAIVSQEMKQVEATSGAMKMTNSIFFCIECINYALGSGQNNYLLTSVQRLDWMLFWVGNLIWDTSFSWISSFLQPNSNCVFQTITTFVQRRSFFSAMRDFMKHGCAVFKILS